MYRVISCAVALLSAVVAAAADDSDVCYNRHGSTADESIAACNRMLKLDQKDDQARITMFRGQAYERKGDPDRAFADYNEALRLDPTDPFAYKDRGKAYHARGDLDRAIADYDQSIKFMLQMGSHLDSWYLADAYTFRGSAYNNKGDYDRAIVDFDHAIKVDPKFGRGYNNRGFSYSEKGDYQRAFADFNRAVDLAPESPFVYRNRGAAYTETGDYNRAIVDLDQAINLDPTSADAYNSRGIAYSKKRDPARAIADYDQAITLSPQQAAFYSNRGTAYSDKGEYDRAIADFDEAIGLSPDFPNPYSYRGFAYGRKADFEHAMADLDKAIALNPDYAKGYSNRAAVEELRGDPDRAITDADVAIRLTPKDAFAYNWRGKARFDKGELDLAIADYDEALKLDHAFAEARQNRQAALAASQNQRKSQTVAPGMAAPQPAALSEPASSLVSPERRVALVIGNSQYRTVGALPNPRRDAEAVADALRQAGFQSVELATDLDRDSMVKALRSFRDRADEADWALVYFAGHGIEINRINYLIPVDARLVDDRDVKAEAVSYEDLLNAIGGASALRLVVLDACRDNPFKERMRRTLATRSATDRGLARPPETEPGTLVVYSAKEGEVAEDGVGSNSPFARAFVAQLKVPGREVRRLFDYVRDDVLQATDKRQQPFTYGSLPGVRDFYFMAGK
jgi:tetratricopeptide (TPR) repeat protein